MNIHVDGQSMFSRHPCSPDEWQQAGLWAERQAGHHAVSMLECKRQAAGIALQDLLAASGVPASTYSEAKSRRSSMRRCTLRILKIALDRIIDEQRRQRAIGSAS